MASNATPVAVLPTPAPTLVSGVDVKKMVRKDKEFLNELDSQVKDIRTQLNEQLRCLDYRVETQISVVGELQDFFRRRAEVELDYSKNLDKLSKSLLVRHREQKQKREQWHLFSSYACWQHLVAQTKRQARDHALLSEIYSTTVIQRLSQVTEEVQRIYRRCREVGFESHEELLKVLHELHTAMKTSQSYQIEYRQAETKLRYVESQRSKLESSIAKEKLEKSKKFKLIEKEILKRRNKFNDAHVKALKARNEYVLCMDAANAAIHKYFVDDLSDIIDCMDIGFHNCVARALMMHISAEENVRRSLQVSVDGMNKCLSNLDSRADKQRFLEANHSAFMIPKKFDSSNYQHKIEEGVHELSVVSQVKEELESRYLQLHKRLTSLRAESEEVWKTLETAESTLMEMISAKDYDVSPLFAAAAAAAAAGQEDEKNFLLTVAPFNRQPEAALTKLRSDRQETEDFYLNKFREYVMGSNLMHRLQAKYELIHKALTQDGAQLPASPKLTAPLTTSVLGSNVSGPKGHSMINKPRRRRIGRTPLIGQPKLFGGSLEEYLEATNEEIPLIMKSCIRVINLYGLHHQGIFRVSGSQVEINNFRESFERGEDPLADVTDASDINSVAGVFKLFLRELREPLFPIVFFDQFMEIAQLDLKEEFKTRMREVFQTLPRPVFIVMRYLFSFLNHLSEYSDENMMDPYNLAICFGPTLVPVPEDKDQVQYQNLVNELIKNIIINAEDIFHNDGGTLYERYISREPDEGEVGEAPSDTLSEDVDSEVYPSEDDSVFREKDISIQIFGKSETLEAVAQFDFTARSQRELSFKKGDHLCLYTQVSGDWWKGSKDGRGGLVPDKYIMLRIRDEDKERVEPTKILSTGSTSSGSEDSAVRRRTSSSSDVSGSISMTKKPKEILSQRNSQQQQQRREEEPASPAEPKRSEDENGGESSVHNPNIESLPSLSTDKNLDKSSPDSCPGISGTTVRPNSLSCPSPCQATVHSSAVAKTVPSPPPPTSLTPSVTSSVVICTNGGSSPSGISIPIVQAVESVAKETVRMSEEKPSAAAVQEKAAFNGTPVSMELEQQQVANDDDDGTASLALSDDKSLCDSFTSLDIEASEGTPARVDQGSQARSLEHLEISAVNTPARLSGTGEEVGATPFRRQTWETRSMTNLERIIHPSASSPGVSLLVSGWAEVNPAASAASTGVNKGSFVRKRDLWEKRSSIGQTTPTGLNLRQKHTPDLVMDLPPSLPLSSSPKNESQIEEAVSAASAMLASTVSLQRQTHQSDDSSSSSSGSSGSASPGSPDCMTTAAETFAMQNQSTLKKSAVRPTKKPSPEAATASSPSSSNAAVVIQPPSAQEISLGPEISTAPPAVPNVRAKTTPKLAAKFPHLYATPMPVLPNAFAAAQAEAAITAADPMKHQVKMKPQVMKKPALPPMTSPDNVRRSPSFQQDSADV